MEGSIAKVSSSDGITGTKSGTGCKNPLISMSGPTCSSSMGSINAHIIKRMKDILQNIHAEYSYY
jgi:hypothetical protein